MATSTENIETKISELAKSRNHPRLALHRALEDARQFGGLMMTELEKIDKNGATNTASIARETRSYRANLQRILEDAAAYDEQLIAIDNAIDALADMIGTEG